MSATVPTWAHGHETEDPLEVSQHEWKGFISCAAATPLVMVAPCGQLDANDHSVHGFTAAPDLQTIVVAMAWDAHPIAGPQRLRLLLTDEGAESTEDAHVDLIGSSPVEFRLDVGEDFDPVDEEWDLQFRVILPFELQVAYQQVFDVYYHLFYGKPAPEDHSALPDA